MGGSCSIVSSLFSPSVSFLHLIHHLFSIHHFPALRCRAVVQQKVSAALPCPAVHYHLRKWFYIFGTCLPTNLGPTPGSGGPGEGNWQGSAGEGEVWGNSSMMEVIPDTLSADCVGETEREPIVPPQPPIPPFFLLPLFLLSWELVQVQRPDQTPDPMHSAQLLPACPPLSTLRFSTLGRNPPTAQ